MNNLNLNNLPTINGDHNLAINGNNNILNDDKTKKELTNNQNTDFNISENDLEILKYFKKRTRK